MKKDFLIILGMIIMLSLPLISCQLSDETKIQLFPEEVSSQEYFDKVIRHSKVIDEYGHELIFHEVNTRGYREYAFSIEHSPECKKCCEIYD